MSQFLRYIIVGGFNTVLGYLIIFACMYSIKLSPEVSNAVGYTVGLMSSYILNRAYTFNSTKNRYSEIVRFVTVFIIAYATNIAVLIFMIRKVGLNEAVSQVLAGIIYVATSFIMNKHYVFKISKSGYPQD